MAGEHLDLKARHPQTPTAKWVRYVEGVREAAIRSAEHRASRDQAEHRATDYARTESGEPTKG